MERAPGSPSSVLFGDRDEPQVLPHDHGFAPPAKFQKEDESSDFYYGLLNVAKTASDEEIRAAYKRLCKQLHPDKFAGDAERERAARWFQRVQEAYAVLSDPRQRRVYDAVGAQGLTGQHRWLTVWDATPDQIKAAFAQRKLAEERERRARQFALRAKARLSGPRAPALEMQATSELGREWLAQLRISRVLETTLAWRPHAQAPPRAHLSLQGLAGGMASLLPPWLYAGRLRGDGPLLELRGTLVPPQVERPLTLDAGLSALLAPRGLSAAWLVLGAERRLTPQLSALLESSWSRWGELRAGLRWSPDKEVPGSQEGNSDNEPAVRRSAAELGVRLRPAGQLAPEMYVKLRRALSKRAELESTASLDTELSAHWGVTVRRYVSPHVALGLGVAFGPGPGLSLVPSLLVHGHELSCPLQLGHLGWGRGAAVVLTAYVSLRLLKWFVLAPLRRRQKRTAIRKLQKRMRVATAEAQRRAEEQASLMAETVELKRAREEQAGGLVVLQARYGPEPGQPAGRAIDVCGPLQYQVEAGQLHIPGGLSKAALPGFWDVAPGEHKQLYVLYMLRHKIMPALTVDDDEPLTLPLPQDA